MAPPSAQYRTVQGGRLFDVQVPVNWRSIASNNTIKFAPDNGYGVFNGQSVFTHGIEFGVTSVVPQSDAAAYNAAFSRAAATLRLKDAR